MTREFVSHVRSERGQKSGNTDVAFIPCGNCLAFDMELCGVGREAWDGGSEFALIILKFSICMIRIHI